MIPSIEILAKQIAKDLKGSRLSEKSNPENPVTSQTMCTAYMALYKWEITDREIRGATKLLIEQNVPIGSTLSGYYYVLKSKEWDPTLSMLMPKFLSIKSKIDLINEMKFEMAAKEAQQQEIEFSPVGQVLKKGLDLERIS